jgi:hypothetical protein
MGDGREVDTTDDEDFFVVVPNLMEMIPHSTKCIHVYDICHLFGLKYTYGTVSYPTTLIPLLVTSLAALQKNNGILFYLTLTLIILNHVDSDL